MGVVGKDTIMEMQGKFFELVVSASADVNLHLPQRKAQSSTADLTSRQVATKYPNITRRFFEAKGMDVEHHQDRRLS